jgi:hypothetical protein
MAVGKSEHLNAIPDVHSTARSWTLGSLISKAIPNFLSSAVWFTYDILVTRPLRAFYFEGPIWRSQPPEEICYEMTGVEARHWTSSPDNIARCQMEMDRRFQSWDRTAMTIMHFALLTFVVVKLVCCCACSRPDRPGGHPCGCNFDHSAGDARLVTREELRSMLRAAIQEPPPQVAQ